MLAEASNGGRVHPCSKILVVEDDPDTREILVEFFAAHGYEVIAVATAEAGLEELQGRTADVVLSDNQLDGGESGAWMLERAYSEGLLEKVAAVMYTAGPTIPDDPTRPFACALQSRRRSARSKRPPNARWTRSAYA